MQTYIHAVRVRPFVRYSHSRIIAWNKTIEDLFSRDVTWIFRAGTFLLAGAETTGRSHFQHPLRWSLVSFVAGVVVVAVVFTSITFLVTTASSIHRSIRHTTQKRFLTTYPPTRQPTWYQAHPPPNVLLPKQSFAARLLTPYMYYYIYVRPSIFNPPPLYATRINT